MILFVSEITEIFSKSRDPEELKYVWEQWRKIAGAPVRDLYTEYVQLKNEAARLNSKLYNCMSLNYIETNYLYSLCDKRK